MSGPTTGHSHRPTTKVSHKAFKSRKASKGALRDVAKGKVPNERRKTPHQQVMSKLERRNQAKQRQLVKHREHQSQKSVFSGRDGAPRIIAVLPLCEDGDALGAIKNLNDSLDIASDLGDGPSFRIPVDRFKQKLQYMPLTRDLTSCLDAARVADFVIVILSASVEVDELGELILRSVESQGISTLFTLVQGLNDVQPAKQQVNILASLKSFITHFHPEQEKLFNLDNRQECSNLMRSLCNTTPRGIRWRDERSWMLVENVEFPSSESGSTVLTGVVRGKGLKADRLVQVGSWGVFQIDKITAAPIEKRKAKDEMALDQDEAEKVLEVPGESQDEVADLAPEDANMACGREVDGVATSVAPSERKGVLLDDHHYFSEEELEEQTVKKRVPKGTSNYQAAWYLDDEASESGSDLEDFEMKDVESTAEPTVPADGIEGYAPRDPTEAAPSEYPESEMFVEPHEDEDAQELARYRSRRRNEADDDKEFPDEIELHPQTLARERLARYRGLKSLRTSPWDLQEDIPHQPDDWYRLLQIPDYQASRIRASREALVGGVAPGTRVHVHLRDVPATVQESYEPGHPVSLFSLLQHENKKTAVNYLINLSSDHTESLKSKEELIVQCGSRRFTITPLFSQLGTTPNDVHKYCRYLHPSQSAIATFLGPVTWGSVPVLFFKKSCDNKGEQEGAGLGLKLIATGTSLPPSTSRVIAKRVILTGHPYHIHKKIVTVRYMFFNREDVEWFKALPLWTKRGRSGYIRECLGTHGYFKANFDGRINPQDAVGVSLYKRVWPRHAVPLNKPLGISPGTATRDAMMGVEIVS